MHLLGQVDIGVIWIKAGFCSPAGLWRDCIQGVDIGQAGFPPSLAQVDLDSKFLEPPSLAKVDLGSRLLASFLPVRGRFSQVISQSLAVQQDWFSPRMKHILPYVMSSLFIDRDKEESCTKDVPTVAMALSKPPFCPLLIPPNHLVFQALQLSTVMSGLRSLH